MGCGASALGQVQGALKKSGPSAPGKNNAVMAVDSDEAVGGTPPKGGEGAEKGAGTDDATTPASSEQGQAPQTLEEEGVTAGASEPATAAEVGEVKPGAAAAAAAVADGFVAPTSEGDDRKGFDNYSTYNQYQEHGLTEADLRARVDESKETKTITIHGGLGTDGMTSTLSFDLRYAHVSQRGFYPATPNKANQDSYNVEEQFCGDPNSLMVGVYDGHGSTGDLCAQFASKNLPKNLIRRLGKKAKANGGTYSELSDEEVLEQGYSCHKETDDAIHQAQFDDSLSGTTACSILLREDTLFVNNVGDSRAIIARQGEDGLLKAVPLSLDQTPFRRDERERIKASGGKVMTIDQLEGYEPIHEDWDTQLGEELDDQGDPPRVWCADLERPGCAFTRSLGDNVAKSVGVCPDPEQVCRRLTKDDRFIVVASDGVWEFMTSKQVMEVIDRYEDPLEAARHVVQESFRLWLQYETRTDDITIIILFVENFTEGPRGGEGEGRGAEAGGEGGKTGSGEESAASAHTRRISKKISMVSPEGIETVGMRPVRRHFGNDAQRRLLGNEQDGELGGANATASLTNTMGSVKTAEEKEVMARCLKALPLFAKLSETQLDLIIHAMNKEEVEPGDIVIKEKDDGDKFYMVGAGGYVVSVADAKGKDKRVGDISASGSCFGELALMYGEPRTATIKCTSTGFLWTLDRSSFRHCIAMGILREVVLKALRHTPETKALTPLEMGDLADRMEEVKLEDGAFLGRSGETPDRMYIVVAGEIVPKLGPKSVIAQWAITGEEKPFEMDFVAKGATRLMTVKAADLNAVTAGGG